MRILGSIVKPSTAFMAFCDSKVIRCSPIRAQVIRDELVWDKAIFLQQLAHQFERRPLVASVWTSTSRTSPSAYGTPEVDQATIDLEIDFIEMRDAR